MPGLLRHGPSIWKGLYGASSGVPFKSDLNTWHKGIDGITFTESINNLPAKFLPRLAILNGTDDKIELSADINIGKQFVLTIPVCISSFATINTITSKGINETFRIVSNVLTQLRINSTSYNLDHLGALSLDTVYVFELTRDGKNVSLKIDTVLQDSIVLADLDNIDFEISSLFAREANDLNYEGLCPYIDIVSTDQTSFFMPLLGQGFEWDLTVGSAIYGTWSGTGTRFDYSLDGSTYPNTQGYSLWQKAANPDIQVPFDINGDPLSLTAGVDIPIGYTKTRDIVAGGNKWNMADALLDMEYGSILQNDTAGIAYATQAEAYGCVFDGIINKKLDANISTIRIITLTTGSAAIDFNDSYTLQIQANESIRFVQGQSTVLFLTVASYISINTDYRYLIWRNETLNQFVTGAIGTFSVYIQGKSKPITNKNYLIPNLSEMELVVADTGTNPVTDNNYTTSLYQVHSLTAGDQVSKLKANCIYISPYDFIVSTGAYSIIDNALNAIFNRTNATRQTATSRASLFYNANFPFTYQVNEIADPRIYDTFFEALSKDIVFGKVLLSGTDLIRYDEQLNYATQKTGADLTKVTDYCKITDIYP